VTPSNPARSQRILLRGAIDYAGLFPPAAVSMRQAVANYASYRASADAWALGRFICSASRLPELGAALDARDEIGHADGWLVAATLGEDWPADRARILRFNQRSDARVDALEGRVAGPDSVRELASFVDDGFAVYGEVGATDLDPMLQALLLSGASAKIRMGGVTPDRFPPAPDVAAFLTAVSRVGIPFKATAGLHHAFHGEYRLTYEPSSPCTAMHGFLNLFIGAALLDAGKIEEHDLRAVLRERARGAFQLEADGTVRWRDRGARAAEVRRARARLLHSFGTCSFGEPVQELRTLGALA
jgi:hypothetical protein